jgi:hypothetical protein
MTAAIPVASTLAALAGGLAIGYADQHVTEVVVTLGLIFVLNLGLSAIWLRGSWKFPILSALAAAFRIWLAAGPGNPHLPHTWPSFAALSGILFASGAVATGALYALRRN